MDSSIDRDRIRYEMFQLARYMGEVLADARPLYGDAEIVFEGERMTINRLEERLRVVNDVLAELQRMGFR